MRRSTPFYRGGFSDELVHHAWHALLVYLRGVSLRSPFHAGAETAKQLAEAAPDFDAVKRQAVQITRCRREREASFVLSLLLSGLKVTAKGGARRAARPARTGLELP